MGHLQAGVAGIEQRDRGCEQVVVSTHDFQAPGFYERLGFARVGVIDGMPTVHAAFVYVKRL